MITEEQRAKAQKIRLKNPVENSPRLTIDRSDQSTVNALRALLETLKADFETKTSHWAPEILNSHSYFYAPALVEQLIRDGELNTWAAARALPGQPEGGSGFYDACKEIEAVSGVTYVLGRSDSQPV